MVTKIWPLTVSSGIPTISPDFDSGWNITTGAIRRWMIINNPVGNQFPYETDDRSQSETSGSVVDVLLAQYISAPLEGDQTISGTLKGRIRAWEEFTASADADMRSQLLAKVVSNDGSTVRGTLLGFDTGALSEEWGNLGSSSNARSRYFPRGGAQSLSSVNALDGDRLVIEVGYRAHNTLTASRKGGIVVDSSRTTLWGFGDDLDEDDNDTIGIAWFEFSQDLTFELPALRATEIHAEVIARNPSPAIRTTAIRAEVLIEEWAVYVDILGYDGGG